MERLKRRRSFFERLGVKTRLSDYGIDADGIPLVVEQLEKHGMVTLGERRGRDARDGAQGAGTLPVRPIPGAVVQWCNDRSIQ